MKFKISSDFPEMLTPELEILWNQSQEEGRTLYGTAQSLNKSVLSLQHKHEFKMPYLPGYGSLYDPRYEEFKWCGLNTTISDFLIIV